MYGRRRLTHAIASILRSLSSCASSVATAPLAWALAATATAITILVSISAARHGRLATDAVVEFICAVMAAGVAATEWSSVGRRQRRRRRRGGVSHQPR